MGLHWKAGRLLHSSSHSVCRLLELCKIGRKFGNVAKRDEYAVRDFESLISEFLAHWNREHKGITREIKR